MFAAVGSPASQRTTSKSLSILRTLRLVGLLAAAASSAAAADPLLPAVAPHSVARQHARQLAEGAEPVDLLSQARAEWQQQPSLWSAARLLVALDEPSLRKQHLDEVVSAADRLIAKVKAADMRLEERTAWLADSLYRKGRALGYMELPDVLQVRRIENPQQHNARFEATFAELDALVDTTQPEFILLRIRRERRRGKYDEALRLLEIYRDTAADPLWYDKKHRAITREAASAAN